jgi:hypothetical protein
VTWGRAFLAGEGWYEGEAQQAPGSVPALTPISIGSRTYVIEASKYKRSTIAALRPSMDQAPEPGEVSLNNAGLWRRSQSDWRLGANQLMFDENDSKRQRYWTSKGFNPHPDTAAVAYQLRLHKDVAKIRTSANTNLALVVCGSYLYVIDGAEMYWTTALNGGSTTWTAAGFSAATGGTAIIDACFDGAYVYAAIGGGGLFRSAAGSTTAVKFSAAAHTFNKTAYANGQLFAFSGPTLWQLNASGQVDGDTTANVGTLTAPTGTSPITSLAVTPTTLPIASGATVTLTNGIHSQNFTTSGIVAAGSTAIPITSATPTFNYPTGNPVVAVVTAATGLLAYTHPNPAFVWNETLSTPHGIFVTGDSGASGEMYRIDTNTSDGSLVAPESMFILPAGEHLNDMCYYSGALIIGTSRGVRIAVVQVSFVISATYGPVILINGGVNSVFGYGEFAWFAWSNYDNLSTGLGRLDLARFAADETPAMSSDLLAGTSANPVQGQVSSVANFGGLPAFAVSGAGFWSEHPTDYVPSATINVGRIKFGTTEPKLPLFVDLYHDPLPAGASVSVSVIDEYGTVHTGGTSTTQGSIRPAPELALNYSGRSEQLQLVFTVNNGTDLTSPPVLRRWTLKALVVPQRLDRIEVPILLYRNVKNDQADGGEAYYDTLDEFLYLKGLEAAGTPVLYKEGDNVELVYIDQVEFDGDKWDPVDHHYLEGVCTVAMITLGGTV